MDISIKTMVLPLIITLAGCTLNSGKSPCENMEGQYQRIDSSLAIKDNRDISLYLKHIDGTSNGYYGILDYVDFKQSLQPLVKENPQCAVVFEIATLFYVENKREYGCNIVLRDNADHTRFYCLRKKANKLPVDMDRAFAAVKNETYFDNMSDVDSAIQWNNRR